MRVDTERENELATHLGTGATLSHAVKKAFLGAGLVIAKVLAALRRKNTRRYYYDAERRGYLAEREAKRLRAKHLNHY